MPRTPSTGHAAEFEAFVRQDGPRLLRFATVLTGDLVSAEDLVQTALTNTFAHWASARRAEPAAYVRRAIVNTRTSTWRRLRREERFPDHYDITQSGDAYGVADERLLLLAVLGQLPRAQRVTVVLRYLEGWDDAAIADALGIRQTTVRSHALRGLTRLRVLLEDPPHGITLTLARGPLAPSFSSDAWSRA